MYATVKTGLLQGQPRGGFQLSSPPDRARCPQYTGSLATRLVGVLGRPSRHLGLSVLRVAGGTAGLGLQVEDARGYVSQSARIICVAV